MVRDKYQDRQYILRHERITLDWYMKCLMHCWACTSVRVYYESIWSKKCGLPWPSPLAVSTSTPVSVTIMVCSNWADHLPSVVTAVQSSGQSVSFHTPTQRENDNKLSPECYHILIRCYNFSPNKRRWFSNHVSRLIWTFSDIPDST